MNKKIWSAPIALVVVLVAALVFGGITVSADTVASGECGDNATWTLDSEGTLTISGTGEMAEYSWKSSPWYPQEENIKAIVIGDGITKISSYAFAYLKHATTVSIGSGVTEIGYSAFYNDTALISVTIPANVETMGTGVFQQCYALTTVTFAGQSSLTEIPYYTFYDCDNLTSISIPDSVTSIGGYAFDECDGLTAITIPSSVKTIGESAFYYCSNLTSVTLNEGLTSIERCAFEYCRKLTTVNFPSTLTSIEYEAFSYTGFTSIVLPSTLTVIGERSFACCTNLETASFTLTAEMNSSGVFSGCNKLKTVEIDGDAIALTYNMFNGCESLTSVTLPDTIEIIYPYAFHNCTDLESVTLPSKLKEIRSYCFQGCESLTSIVLPESLEKIGSYAFSGSGLTSISIPKNAELAEDIFSGCEDLQSVTFAEGVTSIPDYTFVGCTSLKTANIPESVTYIGYSAFAESSIESVVIPGSVKTIGDYAFYRCYKLMSVTISEGVETIGEVAFCECSALESITIPGTVKVVKGETFANCYSLKYLELCDGVEEIWQAAFLDCRSLETIILSSTMVDIRYQAFFGCTGVNDIYCNALPGFNWDDYYDDFKEPGLKSTICHVGEGLADDFAAYYSRVNVSFVDGTVGDARLIGHSITLSADIGVNFFIRLPEGYDSSNTEVTFTWGYGDRARTVKGKLVAINQYGATYKVTCGVAACEMGDEITMVVKSGNEELIKDTYSVIQYINVLSHLTNSEDLQNLLAAMVYYGSYSQQYFEYRKDKDICYIADVDYDYFDTIWEYRENLEFDYPDPTFLTIMSIDSDALGIKYYGASVLCGSQNKIRFYFEVKDPAKISSLTASYGSTNITFKSRTVSGKNLVYIETPGLAAGDIEKPITVKICGEEYTYDFRYYIQQCIAKNSEQKFAYTACYLYAVSHYARIYQEGI